MESKFTIIIYYSMSCITSVSYTHLELLSGSYPHRGTLGGFGLDHAVEELDLLGVLGQGHDSLLGCSGVRCV